MNIGRKTAKKRLRNSARETLAGCAASRASALMGGRGAIFSPGIRAALAPAAAPLHAVDPYAMHAERVAQHARAAAGKILRLPQRRDADPLRVEQHEVGVPPRRDHATAGNAVLS